MASLPPVSDDQADRDNWVSSWTACSIHETLNVLIKDDKDVSTLQLVLDLEHAFLDTHSMGIGPKAPLASSAGKRTRL